MLHARISGQGLPLVLLHGFCEDGSLWDELTPGWAGKCRVIAPDLPGFGQSPPPPPGFSLEEVAGTVHRYLTDHLHLNEYVVLGHSLGGYIALALAATHRSSLLAAGLINSTALADSDEKKATRTKTARFIRQHGVAAFSETFVPNLFAPQNREKLAGKLEKVRQMSHHLDKEVVAGYMLAMRDRPQRLNILTEMTPFLFVSGLQDQHISHQDTERQINLLSNKELAHCWPDVAHMSMYEAPQRLNEAVLNLMNLVKG